MKYIASNGGMGMAIGKDGGCMVICDDPWPAPEMLAYLRETCPPEPRMTRQRWFMLAAIIVLLVVGLGAWIAG